MHLPVALFFFLTLVPLRVPSDAKFPGDDEFVRGEYANAVAAYDSVITTGNAQAQALWRLARVHVCLADVADHELKELLYRKAEKYARECISTDSTLSEGHSWLAVALGNIATFQGSKTKESKEENGVNYKGKLIKKTCVLCYCS